MTDMEEKVGEMMKIIDDDGDSFAQRAEMYYRKRPELINFVEDSYRSYRALAERYDHLSKELQSANRTIATVFPEHVQFAMDAEDEENQGVSSPSNKAAFKPNANIPNVPAIPKKDFMAPFLRMAKKGLKGNSSSAKAAAAVPLKSGFNKEEALEEIDKLQKGILGLQTEKEFAKSSYERGYEKYWEIENQITEMQAKVCNLQDEFGIGTVIDDNEARTLMAATAVKSCQDTLSELQEKQEQSVEEAKTEQQRIIEAHEKFIKLRNRFIVNQTDEQEQEQEQEQPQEENENKTTAGSELKADLAPRGKSDVELSSKKIEDQVAVDSNESLTVTQLAEKIDELVDKVVNLESAVSSQTALVKTLRSETDQLEGHISRLEGEKESLIADSDGMKKRLTAVEEELHRIKSLNRSIDDQNNNLQTHFVEAASSADYLSEKLQSGMIEEDVENAGLFREVKATSDAKNEKNDSILTSGAEKEEENDTVNAQREDNDSGPSDKPDEKKFVSETASINLDTEPDEPGIEDGEETPNWRMLSSGLEDREKILLEEYTSVLHNYKDVRRKLSEMEKKNRDRFIELALQIRELENAVAFRDEEIHALRQKLGTVSHTSLHETMDTHSSLTESHQEREEEQEQEQSHESITQTTATPVSHFSFLGSSQQPAPSSSEHIYDYEERIDLKKYPKREQSKVNVKHVKIHCAISPIEEKIRADIDELLEENLEFWLRFSTSVHQIQKYQTTVQDLKAELARLKDKKKEEGSAKQRYTKSDARPIYKHLREIQTELTLWQENNEVLKDEVQDRYTSLCNIQEEVSRVANASASAKAEDAELSNYQAAKFQGEIMNMKQENKKIADELHAGLDCVKQLRVEVEKTLAKLDEQLRHHAPMRSSATRARIPLHSFLFGVKLKKQGQKQKPSLFSCMSPALQRQYSDHLPARCPQ